MNDTLVMFARLNLKDNLAKCSLGQQMFFKRMYSHKDLEAKIESVVDSMPDEKLDWAMQQVQRQLAVNAKQALKEAGETK